MAKVLVADDEPTITKLVTVALSRKGHQVTVVGNGKDALAALQREKFDVVFTDWMMPEMDGLTLVRKVRAMVRPIPGIIMMTAILLDKSREQALNCGADDYLEKPVSPVALVEALDRYLARLKQSATPAAPLPVNKVVSRSATHGAAPCVAIVIASSTGGPDTVMKVLPAIGVCPNAAILLVQHGPAWMLEAFAKRLQMETSLKVHLATDDQPIEPGHLYLAPGERHLCVRPSYRTLISNDPPENFVKPAADPLFRSAAAAFGSKCIGVVLTGMGHDGMHGAAAIAEQGGQVFVQDPKSAVVASMPQSVVNSGIRHDVQPLEAIGGAIARCVKKLG